MLRLLFTALFSFLVHLSIAQSEEEQFVIVEDMPVFEGCEKEGHKQEADQCTQANIYKHLDNNSRYPLELKEASVEGTVFIRFVINTEGFAVNPTVIRNTTSNDYCGLDAMRTVLTLPRFKPGTQRGKAVPVSYTVPIRYNKKRQKVATDSLKDIYLPTHPAIFKDVLFPEDYLHQNLIYPAEAKDSCKTGIVYLEFTIDSLGRISDIEPLFDSYPQLIDAAKQTLLLTEGKWNPAREDGKLLNTELQLKISFNAENNKCDKQNDIFNAAVQHFQNQEYEKASQKFEKAILMNGKDIDAYFNCAASYAKLKQFERACELLNFVKSEPDAKSLIKEYCGN